MFISLSSCSSQTKITNRQSQCSQQFRRLLKMSILVYISLCKIANFLLKCASGFTSLVAYLIYRLRSNFSAPSHLLAIRTFVFLPVYDRTTDIPFVSFFFNQSQCNSAFGSWEQCFWLYERQGKGWKYRCTIVQQYNCMTVWCKQILCGHFHFVRLARFDATPYFLKVMRWIF